MKPEILKKKWPKIEEQLETADILLFHKRKGSITKRIQEGTGSYWNHIALIFKPKSEMPIGGPLIVEAAYSGIEIHQLKKYADQFELYDIGVRRFPDLTEQQKQDIVLNFILKNLDQPYDYIRLVGLFLAPLLVRISPKILLKATDYFIHENAFLCSTFAMKAFQRISEKQNQNKSFEKKLGVKPKKKYRQELYAPADISGSDMFEWIFNPRR